MARLVVVDGQHYKQRNIFGVWLGLPLITLGIYHFFWYYKINDEARRFLRDDSIKPWISVLALLFGWILIVPPFYSIYQTGRRVQRMEQQAGVTSQIEPVLALIFAFIVSAHILYIQAHLNSVWDRYSNPAPASVPVA